MKKLACLIFVVIILLSMPFSIVANASDNQVPYDSYTYWSCGSQTRKAVHNRNLFNCETVIDSSVIGVKDFEKINDICTDKAGNVYILDNASRITVLDNNYILKSEIISITSDDKSFNFAGAQNIFVHTDGTFYISDTENKRVLHCDSNGLLLENILLPDSPLIPDEFEYRPLCCTVDSYGYLYVLSDGSYYGALMYDNERNFLGFYGANKTSTGILGALENIKNRIFVNSAKKSSSARKLPYVFSDIVVDKEDFLYTATGFTKKNDDKAQIKRLNPGFGNNIFGSDDVNFTDDNVNMTFKITESFDQNIQSIAIDDDGFVYCLDASYGRVFLYDAECNMVTAFGGGMSNGKQDGTFMSASAIALNGNDVIVSDNQSNTITVFKINDYGNKVMKLCTLTHNGKYAETLEGWKQVISEDKNLQLAYSGLAKAYIAKKDYTKALKYAKEGYDRESYAIAFEFTRKQYLSDNFWLIFCGTVVMIAAIISFTVIASRKKIKVVKNEQIGLMFNSMIHPAVVFENVKEKGTGSVTLSIILIAVFYITSVMEVICGGFMYQAGTTSSFNSLLVLLRSVGFVLLWIISNWLVCSLLGGRGKLKEIFIVTSYGLLPMIFGQIISSVLTNVLLPSEIVFLNIIETVALLYSLLIIVVGMLKIHDFGMMRFIGTTVLSFLGMAAVAFLLIMLVILLQQLGGFIVTVVAEALM